MPKHGIPGCRSGQCWNLGIIKCSAEGYLNHHRGQYPHMMGCADGSQSVFLLYQCVSPRDALEMHVHGSY